MITKLTKRDVTIRVVYVCLLIIYFFKAIFKNNNKG